MFSLWSWLAEAREEKKELEPSGVSDEELSDSELLNIESDFDVDDGE